MRYLTKYISIALIINLAFLNPSNSMGLKEPKLLNVNIDAKTQREIYKICDDNNISFALAMAIIQQESKYNPKAVGDNGNSIGLMQVQPKWHQERMKRLGATDLFDPRQNALVAMDFLRELFERHGDVHQVLMAYNMGERGAKRLWDKGIYKSEYSKEVVDRSIKFERSLEK